MFLFLLQGQSLVLPSVSQAPLWPKVRGRPTRPEDMGGAAWGDSGWRAGRLEWTKADSITSKADRRLTARCVEGLATDHCHCSQKELCASLLWRAVARGVKRRRRWNESRSRASADTLALLACPTAPHERGAGRAAAPLTVSWAEMHHLAESTGSGEVRAHSRAGRHRRGGPVSTSGSCVVEKETSQENPGTEGPPTHGDGQGA